MYLEKDVARSINKINDVMGHIQNKNNLTNEIVNSLRSDLITVIHFFESKLQIIETVIVESMDKTKKNGN